MRNMPYSGPRVSHSLGKISFLSAAHTYAVATSVRDVSVCVYDYDCVCVFGALGIGIYIDLIETYRKTLLCCAFDIDTQIYSGGCSVATDQLNHELGMRIISQTIFVETRLNYL